MLLLVYENDYRKQLTVTNYKMSGETTPRVGFPGDVEDSLH